MPHIQPLSPSYFLARFIATQEYPPSVPIQAFSHGSATGPYIWSAAHRPDCCNGVRISLTAILPFLHNLIRIRFLKTLRGNMWPNMPLLSHLSERQPPHEVSGKRHPNVALSV